MTKIKILSELIANKIAAGEVVERPASVVKELIENSLDAQSDRILVDIENGGRRLIRVSDNGVGMRRDDALLAVERYATSKISNDADLFAINTLGFRGEALPSIAAVSKFILVTREPHADEASEIHINGGKLADVSAAGAPAGTMISVQNLFYNTPARRKYLKTVQTEMGHIIDTVASMAMGWPSVQFKLTHNQRLIKHWPPTNEAQTRAAAILGGDVHNALIPIRADAGPIGVSGFIASPRITRRTASHLFVYVNGRFVRDRMIRHALLEGFAGRLMKGRFPVAVLFITAPYDQVDINVHPTKHEVRFAQPRQVHEAVARAVNQTLNQSQHPGRRPSKPAAPSMPPQSKPSIREYLSPYDDNHQNDDPRESPLNNTAPANASPISPKTKKSSASQAPLWKQKFFSDLRFIGELHNTYLLCESRDGLILVDQHAAHERILFEDLKRQVDLANPPVQKRLVPETFDLSYREAEALKKLIPTFQSLGLEIEPFGGATFVVKAVPALLAGYEIKPLLMEIAAQMASIGFSRDFAKTLDECLMLVACHSALRANQAITPEQAHTLFKQMDACDNPSFCPHGRPTWIRWSKGDLQKRFHR